MQIAQDLLRFSEQQEMPIQRRAGFPERAEAPMSGVRAPIGRAEQIGHKRRLLCAITRTCSVNPVRDPVDARDVRV